MTEHEEQVTAEAYDAILPQLSHAMTLYRHHQLNLAHERRKAKVLIEALEDQPAGIVQRIREWCRQWM